MIQFMLKPSALYTDGENNRSEESRRERKGRGRGRGRNKRGERREERSRHTKMDINPNLFFLFLLGC